MRPCSLHTTGRAVFNIGRLKSAATGRPWERKFLGFRLNCLRRITIAPESLERFKAKVREMWRSCQSLTSEQLAEQWQQFIRGWWGYYQITEDRKPIFQLEGWIRRHIRKFFWLRWHKPAGRKRKLRSLGLKGDLLKVAHSQQQRSVASCRYRQP